MVSHIAPRAEIVASNNTQAVASGEFGRDYDPAHRERPFLPADLFEAYGSWVELEDPGNSEPVASEFRGRALAAWSEERGVRLEFIQPGKHQRKMHTQEASAGGNAMNA